jgi:hypothetical protein
MSKLREMLSDVEYETVKIWCKPIPFPVRLILPDEAKETMPLALVKSIDGNRILRFYTPPVKDDVIEFRGHLWAVIGRFHECQIKGSPKPDRLPTVLTQYLGRSEEEATTLT